MGRLVVISATLLLFTTVIGSDNGSPFSVAVAEPVPVPRPRQAEATISSLPGSWRSGRRHRRWRGCSECYQRRHDHPDPDGRQLRHAGRRRHGCRAGRRSRCCRSGAGCRRERGDAGGCGYLCHYGGCTRRYHCRRRRHRCGRRKLAIRHLQLVLVPAFLGSRFMILSIGCIPQAVEVRLRPEDRAVLEARVRSPATTQRDALRARVVLLAAEALDPVDCRRTRNHAKHSEYLAGSLCRRRFAWLGRQASPWPKAEVHR